MQVWSRVGNVIAVPFSLIIINKIIWIVFWSNGYFQLTFPYPSGFGDLFNIIAIDTQKDNPSISKDRTHERRMASGGYYPTTRKKRKSVLQLVKNQDSRIFLYRICQKFNEILKQNKILDAVFVRLGNQIRYCISVRRANHQVKTNVVAWIPVYFLPVTIGRIHSNGIAVFETTKIETLQR